jgi:hypothetical protein
MGLGVQVSEMERSGGFGLGTGVQVDGNLNQRRNTEEIFDVFGFWKMLKTDVYSLCSDIVN